MADYNVESLSLSKGEDTYTITSGKGSPVYYVEGSSSDTIGVWTGTIPDLTAYYDGLTVLYVPKKGAKVNELNQGYIDIFSATLNINNLGAKTCTFHRYPNNSGMTIYTKNYLKDPLAYSSMPMMFVYKNNVWYKIDYENTYCIPSAVCPDSGVADKTIYCDVISIGSKSYFQIMFIGNNTAVGQLRLRINQSSSTYYPIYINGVISGSNNYSIPQGMYIAYFDGSKVDIRKDGKLPASISGDAATVNGKTVESNVPDNAVFTDTTYESKAAASGGTDVSLVTTGEKYIWNNKGDGAVTGPVSSVVDHVATFNDTEGKVIKDSGFTIGTSVPANAVFTDTTYESKAAVSGGTDVSLVTTGEKYNWNNQGSPVYYVEGSSSDSTGVWTGTIPNLTEYYDGLTIIYIPKKSAVQSNVAEGSHYIYTATLSINGLGAKNCVFNLYRSQSANNSASRVSIYAQYYYRAMDGYQDKPIILVYKNSIWYKIDYENAFSMPTVICDSSGNATVKEGFYDGPGIPSANSYFGIIFTTTNYYKGQLSLSINYKTPKVIYINGEVSSATNYTFTPGYYIAYYDGTNYHIHTDGKLPASISGDAATVNGKTVLSNVPANAVFTDTTYESKTAASSGTDESLVTTGEKYIWNNKADINSPTFTGTPEAPTASSGTNNTQIATTAFVMNAFQANDAMMFKGTIGSSGATVASLPDTHNKGWTYKVITAGTYAGKNCEIGDMIICVVDGTSADNDHWAVIQANIDGAVIGPNSSTAEHIAIFNGTTGKVIKDSGFTIGASVPANAVFTDTTYESKTAASGGTDESLVTTGEKYIWNQSKPIVYSATTPPESPVEGMIWLRAKTNS